MQMKEEAFRLAHQGLSFVTARKNTEAIDCFLRAIELGLVENDGLYNNLGIAYAREYFLGKAIRSFETALSLNPGNEQARNNLAEAERNLERLSASHNRIRDQARGRELQEQWIDFETPDGRTITRTMSEIESRD
jgi:tetratricopeptide (TPR) repeat protein